MAALQAIRYRHEPASNDIVAYLDIADAYLQGDWTAAISGNWSPLYSWILAVFIWLFEPSDLWEFPLVKLVNLFIFICTLASFEFFLTQFIQHSKQGAFFTASQRWLQVPEWVWLCLGYAVFLISTLQWIGIDCDTPDMATAGIIYLAAGLILKIRLYPQRWQLFWLLGGTLALGYFAKAAMFLLAFVFLLVSLFSTKDWRQTLPRAVAALLVFLLVVSPYITALSLKKGRFTFSETGRLSYAWYVYPTTSVIPDTLWRGEPSEFGKPKHPIRKLFTDPDILEFGEPIGGTYPLWTDPAYWYEGLTYKFDLKSSLRLLLLNLQFYGEMFLGLFAFGYLTVLVWSRQLKIAVVALVSRAHLLAIAASGLSVYGLSTNLTVNSYLHQPSSRFVSAFVVLLFAGACSTIRLPNFKSARRLMAGMVLVTAVFVCSQLWVNAAEDVWAIANNPQSNHHWHIATEMQHLGLKPGDKIAFFGNSDQRSNHIYWARLADAKIVAQIERPEAFWEKNKTVQSKALKALELSGVKVVVQANLPSKNTLGAQWQKVGDTQYYACFLPCLRRCCMNRGC